MGRVERRARVERLEERALLFALPGSPYPVTSTALKAQFTSTIPKVTVGGTSLPISFKIINTTKEAQQGTIDLTFMLHKFDDTPPVSRAADPKILTTAQGSTTPLTTQTSLTLDLKPRGSQVFKYTGTIPEDLPVGSYYFVCSVDPGGFVAMGAGYQSTVLGSALTTFIRPPVTDVNIGSFSFKLDKKKHLGTVSGTIKNYLGSNQESADVAATGSVTLSLLAAFNQDPNGAAALPAIDTSALTVSFKSLGPGKSKKFTVKFAIPQSLQDGQARYLGVQLSRGTAGSPTVNDPLQDPKENFAFFSTRQILLS